MKHQNLRWQFRGLNKNRTISGTMNLKHHLHQTVKNVKSVCFTLWTWVVLFLLYFRFQKRSQFYKIGPRSKENLKVLRKCQQSQFPARWSTDPDFSGLGQLWTGRRWNEGHFPSLCKQLFLFFYCQRCYIGF